MKVEIRRNPFFAPLVGAVAGGAAFILTWVAFAVAARLLIRGLDALAIGILFAGFSSIALAYLVAFVVSKKLE
jgi:hypothetical protein